nr:MAG TPA: hypothetical protein [Microviridae sp.]
MSTLSIISAVVGSISSIAGAISSGQDKARKPTDSAALRSKDPYRFAQNVGVEVNGNYDYYLQICQRYGIQPLSKDEFAQEIANNKHANADAKYGALVNAGYKDVDALGDTLGKSFTQQDQDELLTSSTRTANDSDPIGQMLQQRGAGAVPSSLLPFGSDLYYQDVLNQQAEQRAFAYQTELRDFDNLYNSAVSQRQRFEAAGLNPQLMFGESGTAGTSTNSGAPRTAAPDVAAMGNAEAAQQTADTNKFQAIVQGVNAVFQLGINLFGEIIKQHLGKEQNLIGWADIRNKGKGLQIDAKNAQTNFENAQSNKKNADTNSFAAISTANLQDALENESRARYATEVQESLLKRKLNETFYSTWERQQALYNAQVFSLVTQGKLNEAKKLSENVVTEQNKLLFKQLQIDQQLNYGWLMNMTEQEATDFYSALDKLNKEIFDLRKNTDLSKGQIEKQEARIYAKFMQSKYGQYCTSAGLVLNKTPLLKEGLQLGGQILLKKVGKVPPQSAPSVTQNYFSY